MEPLSEEVVVAQIHATLKEDKDKWKDGLPLRQVVENIPLPLELEKEAVTWMMVDETDIFVKSSLTQIIVMF